MLSRNFLCSVLFRKRTKCQNLFRKRNCFLSCWQERLVSTASVVNQHEKSISNISVFKSLYDLTIPDCSVCEHIFPYLEKHGQKMFLIDGITGQSYTFHDVLLYSQKVASGLKKLGLRKGDCVAISSGNRPEYVISWLAINLVGGIVTEVNPTFTPGELLIQLQMTNSAFLMVGPETVSPAKKCLKSFPQLKKTIVFGEAEGFLPFSQLMQDGQSQINPATVDPTSVAHIPFSSGTTGIPKGVMVSQKGVIGGAMSCVHDVFQVSAHDDIIVLLLPMFHIYGNFLTWCNAVQGATTITLPRFTPESLLSAVQKYRATSLPLVPPLVLFLLQSPLVQKYDLSSVDNIMCGAAPVSVENLEQLSNKFKLKVLRQGYGMSENCPIAMLPREERQQLDSVGQPVAGMELKIVDFNTGQPVSIGETGEICCRSGFQMLGYYNNPEATDATIDADGWLHTGDIGYVTEKRNLYVVDRLKELIKYKGHQVAPAELESLLQSHPAVKDCAVIGVPDERAGEVPRAYVVLDDSSKLSVDDLQKFVSERTSDEKHLRGGVVILDQIPKSASGKILRKDLRNVPASGK